MLMLSSRCTKVPLIIGVLGTTLLILVTTWLKLDISISQTYVVRPNIFSQRSYISEDNQSEEVDAFTFTRDVIDKRHAFSYVNGDVIDDTIDTWCEL